MVSARLDDDYYEKYCKSPFNIRELIEHSLDIDDKSKIEVQLGIFNARLEVCYAEINGKETEIEILKQHINRLNKQYSKFTDKEVYNQKVDEILIESLKNMLEERRSKRNNGGFVPKISNKKYEEWCDTNQLSTTYVYQQLPEHLRNEIDY